MTEQGCDEDCYLNLVTTGKEIYLIGGCTVHSHKFCISIPTGDRKLNDLSSNKLDEEQINLQIFKVIFINEYSMVRWKEFFQILEILKQLKCKNLIFGGMCIVLVEVPAQLPLVQAESL